MSTLSVTTITTENSTTPLRLQTGNTSAASIKIEAANTHIGVTGNLAVSGVISGNGYGIANVVGSMVKLLGPLDMNGSSTFTITNFPGDYREHYILVENASHSNTQNSLNPTIAFSGDNGSTWSTNGRFGDAETSGEIQVIWIKVNNLDGKAGDDSGRTYFSSQNWYGYSFFPWSNGVVVNAIRFAWNGVATWDGKSQVTIYGVNY